MNKQKAKGMAKAFARMNAYQSGDKDRKNEEALLNWLEEVEKKGWVVAYASCYVPNESSVALWGMMVEAGQWEKYREEKNATEWNNLDEGWAYGNGQVKRYAMEWGGEDLNEGYALTYRRQASGRVEDESYVEIDQRITLPEGIHWYDEIEGWGRWNGEEGGPEILLIEGRSRERNGEDGQIVLIAEKVVRNHKLEGNKELIQFIDGTWSTSVMGNNWTTEGEEYLYGEELCYKRSKRHESCAWMRGSRRVRIREIKEQEPTEEDGQHVEFLCWPYLPHEDTEVSTRWSKGV